MRRYNRRLNEEDLYSFDELSDRAKENALDNWADYVLGQNYWVYDTLWNLADEIRDLGFKMSDNDFDYEFSPMGIYKVTKFTAKNHIIPAFKNQPLPDRYMKLLEYNLSKMIQGGSLQNRPAVVRHMDYYAKMVKEVFRSCKKPVLKHYGVSDKYFGRLYFYADDIIDDISDMYFDRYLEEKDVPDNIYGTVENRLKEEMDIVVQNVISIIENDLNSLCLKYANNLQDAFEYETSEEALSDEMNNNFKFRADGTLVWL